MNELNETELEFKNKIEIIMSGIMAFAKMKEATDQEYSDIETIVKALASVSFDYGMYIQEKEIMEVCQSMN